VRQYLAQRDILSKFGVDCGRDRTDGIEEACALRLGGRTGQPPDDYDNDYIQRHREGEYDRDQPHVDRHLPKARRNTPKSCIQRRFVSITGSHDARH
jgi:hypothetical protein